MAKLVNNITSHVKETQLVSTVFPNTNLQSIVQIVAFLTIGQRFRMLFSFLVRSVLFKNNSSLPTTFLLMSLLFSVVCFLNRALEAKGYLQYHTYKKFLELGHLARPSSLDSHFTDGE